MATRQLRAASLLLLATIATAAAAYAQAPVTYRITFPEPEHRWMQVEVTFADLGTAPLQIRMSRSSPGRYAVHEFAKNVFDVGAADGKGRALALARPNAHQWDVAGHDGTVRLTYRIYGDRVDGTFLAIDTTHAHLNMPAALMWARGLESRPARVRFEPPRGAAWKAATQLYPTDDALTFTAPNLQYLMDSPTELSAFTLRTFTIEGAAIRVAVHHENTDAHVDRYAGDVEKIVREARAVFGELPAFDGGTYTFIADYLPYASGDGMEHRNSTVLSSTRGLGSTGERLGNLGTVAHEFFHCWNVERIRPKSLEPFDFEDANMSGELWFAEGFTSYYEDLLMRRAGLTSVADFARDTGAAVDAVVAGAGRHVRSAVEMSQFAPFVDGARTADRTNWENTFISYYTYGAALGLALDLTLRDRSDGKVTLDDYMRALWHRFGKPGGAPGLVDRPYTLADLRDTLAEVAADRAFAESFFTRFIQGREVADYGRLLARAGLVLRRRLPGRAWLGHVSIDPGGRIAATVPAGTPAYAAGLEEDDVLVAIDQETVGSMDRLQAVLATRKPGDRVTIRFDRRGRGTREELTAIVTLAEDPSVEVVPVEAAGGSPGSAERAFRRAWLETQVK